MTRETYEQRILTADEGKYLYNEKERAFSDKVFLGKEANEVDWVEVTKKEKESIEAEWAEWAEDTDAD